MSINSAYIFPNILPEERIVFPLIPLVEQVLFLRPVEDDLPELASPLFHALAERTERSGLLGYTCPAPLAEDRARFFSLLRDICSRPEDYAGHLGNLTAGSGRAVPQEEHEQSIMDTLLQQTGIRAVKQNNTSEAAKGQGKNADSLLLWQARLLLKLGEAVDRNQAEIRRDLDRMLRRREELLRELRKEEEGDGEIELSGLDFPSMDEEPPSTQQRLRLKAWSRLFALSEEQFDRTVFITRSSDAIEALSEYYRQNCGESAKDVLRISLPAFRAGQEEVLSQRERFQEETAALLTSIRAMMRAMLTETLTKIPIGPADAAAPFFSQKDEAAWNEILERYYPAAEHGRSLLSLYLFSDISPRRLFLRTFAPRDALPEHPVNTGVGTGTLLGLLAG